MSLRETRDASERHVFLTYLNILATSKLFSQEKTTVLSTLHTYYAVVVVTTTAAAPEGDQNVTQNASRPARTAGRPATNRARTSKTKEAAPDLFDYPDN